MGERYKENEIKIIPCVSTVTQEISRTRILGDSVKHIVSFLSQTQENDLWLETPLCRQYTHFLHLECRLTYDPNVRAVAKPLRFDKYVYAIFTSLFHRISDTGREPTNSIIAGTKFPTRGYLEKAEGKKQSWCKYPDSAIVFRNSYHD